MGMNFDIFWKLHPTRVKNIYYSKIRLPLSKAIQRSRKGWAVEDSWGWDVRNAELNSQVLRHLANNLHGYPGGIGEEIGLPGPHGLDGEHSGEDSDLCLAYWRGLILEMADGFDAYLKYEDTYDKTHLEKFNKAMKLYVKWYPHLWD